MEINIKSKKEKELKKKIEKQKKIDIIKKEINNIERRYSQTDKNFKDINLNINNRNDKWEIDIDEFEEELKKLKQEIISIKDLINNKDLKLMEKLIIRFKNSAKTSDYEKTTSKLNSWNVENYVTKKRFKKILLEDIEKRI